jgi:chemotaxis protein CheY-P-specific phosphatase CheC
MRSPPDKPEALLEGWIELAAVAADRAAHALGQLVGRSVVSGEAVLWASPRSREPGGWQTALFFETEGSLPGIVAILLTADSRDVLLGMLLGANGEPEPEARASALCELGNIVVSQTVSAMANALGETVLLSLPQLMDGEVGNGLANALAARRSGGGSARIESALSDAGGELRALLVIAPDALDSVDG